MPLYEFDAIYYFKKQIKLDDFGYVGTKRLTRINVL